MHRFFVSPELLAQGVGSTIALPEPLAHQVRTVLRLVPDERLILLDNSGDEVEARVVRSAKSGVEVELLERRPGGRAVGVRIILYQGLLKSARFEWILEKGTELGVTTFAPVLCQRSTAGLEDAGAAKLRRWQRILQEATEQCGGTRLPELAPIRPLRRVLEELPAAALAFMPWEEARGQTLRSALRAAIATSTPPLTIALFIGPEGGLTADEVELARSRGVRVVTLGPRVLRAETAALTSVANVVYECDGRA